MTRIKNVALLVLFLGMAGGLVWLTIENRRLKSDIEARALGEAAARSSADRANEHTRQALEAMISEVQLKQEKGTLTPEDKRFLDNARKSAESRP
jgi:hypothetical protein